MFDKKKHMELVEIPQGKFLMGSTQEEVDHCVTEWANRLVDSKYTQGKFKTWIQKEFPAHTVNLEPYQLGKYPITNAQYAAFLKINGGEKPESMVLAEPLEHPVWGVTHAEAERYCEWLGTVLNARCSLPTEQEWEFAARGHERLEYPYGSEFDSKKANTLESGINRTTPVFQYSEFSSPFGVCDLAGNVEEWVACPYSPYPGGNYIADDLVETLGEGYFVLRGGSFARGGDLSRGARRHGQYPSSEFRYVGFRVVVR